MGESGNVLSVSGLTVKFGEHAIIDNLNFEVKRDTTIAIVGPNGSGKTVLFRAILNLVSYKGEITLADDARIGYVPQKLFIEKDFPLTVCEFLELKEPNREKINKALGLVGFKLKGATHSHHDLRVLTTKIGNLSGGELQRILIAYALLGNPNVLLLDEPTAGVDIEGEKTIYSLFSDLKKDKDLTIIFISHDMGVVEKYADKIIKLGHDH